MSRRSGGAVKKKKSSKTGAFFRKKGKISGYICPNCDGEKSSLRGKCPFCGYAGRSSR